MIYHKLYDAARKNADKTAVVFEDNKVSYSDFIKDIEGYGQQLLAKGVGEKSRVALFFNNCIEYLICFFSIAKTGAMVIPVDSRLTSSEVADVIEQFEAEYLIYDSSVHGDFFKDIIIEKKIEDKLIDIRKLNESKKSSLDEIDVGNEITDDFLIQCAAGGLGKIKGVIHTQKSMMHIADNFTQTVKVKYEDEFLCSYIISSAHATMCIVLPALLNGCTLHIMSINTLVPRHVAKYIEQNRISIYTSMPYFFKLMLETPNIKKEALSSLRFVSAGGAPFTEAVGKEFLDKYHVRLCNLYGKAETGPTHINMSKEAKIPFSSIGVPFVGINSKVMISETQQAMPYEEGELYIKSDSIAKGYWRDEEEEKQVYGKDGWIHTQDIAYVDECSNYYITGRTSQFINVGGNKISPFEIEKVIMKSGLVKDVAVFGSHKGNSLMIESIVACIVPYDTKLDLNLLLEYCKKNLAAYKQVNDFVIIDALPRDNNNKVQKDILLKQYEDKLN